MKTILRILFFIVLKTNLVYGQKTNQPDDLFFRNGMTKVVDADSLKAIKKEINELVENISKVNSTKVAFDLKTEWNLLYKQDYNWTELYPNHSSTVEIYSVTTSEIRMPGDEIFAIFNIDTKRMPLNFLPFVRARGCLYNGEWTATIINEFLIIRYVHSYPDGNQTSWYREKKYFFKKY